MGCSEIAVKIELWISFDPISEKKSSLAAIQSPQIPQKGRTAGSHRTLGGLYYAALKVNPKELPSPTRLSTQIRPPCASMNSLEIDNPSPVPFRSCDPGTLK